MRLDPNQLSTDELKEYLSENRNDSQAFNAALSILMSRRDPNEPSYSPADSEEDIRSILEQKIEENRLHNGALEEIHSARMVKPSFLMRSGIRVEKTNGINLLKFRDDLSDRSEQLLEKHKNWILTAKEKAEYAGICELETILSYVNAQLIANSNS